MVNKNKILSSDFMKQKYKKGGKKGKGFPCFLFTKKYPFVEAVALSLTTLAKKQQVDYKIINRELISL